MRPLLDLKSSFIKSTFPLITYEIFSISSSIHASSLIIGLLQPLVLPVCLGKNKITRNKLLNDLFFIEKLLSSATITIRMTMTVSWRPSTRADGMRKYTRDGSEQGPHCPPCPPASPLQREANRCYTSQDEIFTFYIRREMFMRILHNNTIAFIFLHFDISNTSNEVLLHHTNVVLKVGKV